MVAFFLHRLMKLLTDGHESVIEWSDGAICVHSTKKLETDLLPNYYGHSKFTSFLRQLTSYGFYKTVPDNLSSDGVRYKNGQTTADMSSILKLKRKVSTNSGSKRPSFKKEKDSVKSNNSGVVVSNNKEKKLVIIPSNKEQLSSANTPTPCISLGDEGQYLNTHSHMNFIPNHKLLQTLTVPMAQLKNNSCDSHLSNPPNVISRSSSIVEPTTCLSSPIIQAESYSPRVLKSTVCTSLSSSSIAKPMSCRSNQVNRLPFTNDVNTITSPNINFINKDMISINCQSLSVDTQFYANEDLQFDKDFNNVLSSLMVADFSDQRSFYSEFEDVLNVLVKE